MQSNEEDGSQYMMDSFATASSGMEAAVKSWRISKGSGKSKYLKCHTLH